MQESQKTIVVTGANKGIGFCLVQALAKQGIWNIIMACRNTQLGQQSLNKIKQEFTNTNVTLYQLDVSSFESIDNFCNKLKENNVSIDILINNAAILLRQWTVQALTSIFQTNFYGTIYLTEKILPLISNNGKIITVSSTRAQYPNVIVSEQLKNKWKQPNMTKQELFVLVQQYIDSIGYLVNKVRFYFYPSSKLAISTYVKILSNYPDILSRNIQVYNLHPGYINTDMSQHKATGTVQQGIDTLLYLIQLPFELNKEYQGQLFENRVIVPLDCQQTK